MAALQAIREYGSPERGRALSPYEARCLCLRLTECDQLLQLAILGADGACSTTHGAGDLVAIRCSLEVAEAQIAKARVLADQLAIDPPAANASGARCPS